MTGGRVPFALLGVVVLIGSGSLVATLQQPAVTEPDVERAIDSVSAQSQSALRDAATRAARAGAREPVTARADSPFGSVLNESSPFRDALRIRIYLKVRDNLQRISERRHGISVQASLPAVETPADVRAAKQRIHVERAGENGTALRVRIENVSMTARKKGHVVGTRTVSPTLVVPTPVLAVHDRVSLFERRLQAGPLDPGLGRRLTARLYPVVWARGYAQFEGAPIENVLGNRHVALLTNGAILSMQRDLFGHGDPAGRYVRRRTAATVGLKDVLGGTNTSVTNFLRNADRETGLVKNSADFLNAAETVEPTHTPGESRPVGVNGTADDAFLRAHARLERTINRTYSARVAFRQRVTDLGTHQTQSGSPRESWTLVETDHRSTTTVRPRETAASGGLVADGEHVLASYARTVTRTHVTKREWRTPDGPAHTTERTVDRAAVTFVMAGNHTRGPGPVQPIESVHSPGGPLNGSNLAGVYGSAHRQLVANRGGVDALARQATAGKNRSATTIVDGTLPSGIEAWIYADLVGLRERVRNVSVTTTRGKLATFQSNPPAKLVKKLRQRRARLAEVPDTYPNVAQRARVAARTVYLDEVLESLTSRAGQRRASEQTLDATFDESGASIERLQAGYERRNRDATPEPVAGLEMRVDAEPSYLTRHSLSGDTVPAIPRNGSTHSLVTRNWNVVSVPYGDVADAIVSAIFGPKKTRLSSAGQVLRTVEEANLSVSGDEKPRLESHVSRGIERGRDSARETLASFGLGDEAGRRAVVGEALSRWNTTGARALAMTNGSAAAAIHDEAVKRWSGELTTRSRDLLALRVQRSVRRATTTDEARPPQPAVNGTANELRGAVRDELARRLGNGLEQASNEAIERVAGRSLARLPAGLPVAPAPGLWYATVNLWRVEVAGEYARFIVRVPRGTPATPGAQFQYVRDAGTVRLDVDEDGTRELLGHTSRVGFRTGTDVAIAVPPGPQGVGDVDGQAAEKSPGWPQPGP